MRAGTTFDELSPEGQKAVRDAEAKYGVSQAGMAAEISSKINDDNIAAGKAWYTEAKEFNTELAAKSGLSIEQVTAITSATSARTKWPKNKELAARVAMEHKKFPDIEPTFRDKNGRLDTPTQAAARKMGGGLVRNNLAPALTIARAKDGEVKETIDTNLTGVKRRSFFNNMVDPKGSPDITVDTWMLRAPMNSTTKDGGLSLDDAGDFLNDSKTITKGGAGYVSISEAVRTVAADKGLKPHEVQAAYWIAVSGSKNGLSGD